MKNNLLKYYIAGAFWCSTLIMFAQPGTEDTAGNLEGTTGDQTPAAPIDDYVWVLALVGLVFVLMKFRAIQNRKIKS